MEEMHHTHKETVWGWIGAVLDGFPQRRRTAPNRVKTTPQAVVTPWTPKSPV